MPTYLVIRVEKVVRIIKKNKKQCASFLLVVYVKNKINIFTTIRSICWHWQHWDWGWFIINQAIRNSPDDSLPLRPGGHNTTFSQKSFNVDSSDHRTLFHFASVHLRWARARRSRRRCWMWLINGFSFALSSFNLHLQMQCQHFFYWHWFSEVFLSPHGHILYTPWKGSKVTGIQCLMSIPQLFQYFLPSFLTFVILGKRFISFNIKYVFFPVYCIECIGFCIWALNVAHNQI